MCRRRLERQVLHDNTICKDYCNCACTEAALLLSKQRSLFRVARRGLGAFLIARACTRAPIGEGLHIHQPPPTSEQPPPRSRDGWGAIYLEKVVARDGGEATRPPLTYPRPDKPFSEPIPPRPCTPSSAPARFMQEASNRGNRSAPAEERSRKLVLSTPLHTSPLSP